VENLVDVRRLVTRHFEEHEELLNDLSIQCGYQELLFIRNNGATLGFLFGLLQIALWILWPPPDSCRDDDSGGGLLWGASLNALVAFPAFGLVVGAATNWISLLVIFYPVEPIKLCWGRWMLHGLFLCRQKEVSGLYGRLIGLEVLPPRALVESMLVGQATATPTAPEIKEARGYLPPAPPLPRPPPPPQPLRTDANRDGVTLLDTLMRRHLEASFDNSVDLGGALNVGRQFFLSDDDLAAMREDTVAA
jgi:hypothetical protein